MNLFLAVTFATIYGLTIRLVFGFLHNVMGIMSVTFLILVPVIIGFLTILLMPPEKPRGVVGAFFLPWLTSFVLLIITIALSVEGTICWVMIFPLFATLAGIGGVIGYNIKKKRANRSNKDEWEKPGTVKISLVFLIPLIVGYIEGERTLTPQVFTMKKEIVLTAAPSEVWQQIININEVKPDEKQTPVSSALGFPKHVRTTLDTLAIGCKRIAYYEKGLFFEETITKYEPERLLVLDIKTDPDKIPPTVMDEHIVIGGKHLDILEDTYELEPLPGGSTRLSLSSRFYINTPFNWYAGIWAKFLMSDILQGELDMIENRCLENKRISVRTAGR